MPDAPVHQPERHRGGLRVPGSGGPVPGPGSPGHRELCRVRDRLRLLRGVLRHHLHGAGPDHVRLLRHHAGRHRPGPHPHGHGGPGAESTRAPQGASGQPGRVPGRELHLRRGRDARSQPCVFYSRAGTDRGPGGPLRRRQNHRRQPDSPVLGRVLRRGACGRRGCAGHGPPRAHGSDCLCVPEQPAVQDLHPGERPGRKAETFWKSCQRAWTL